MKTKQERIIEKQAELIKFLDYPQYHEVREAVNRLKSELASIEAEPESKGAKAELDLLQYVTNMLYMAANEGPTMGNPAFDKWVDQQIELLREYAHQPQKEQEDDEDDDTDD